MRFVSLGPTEFKENFLKNIKQIQSITELESYEHDPANNEETIDRLLTSELATSRIYVKFPKEVIEKAKNLKAIFTQSVGFDNIDIEYAKKKGIRVYNCAGFNSIAVSEHAFALILSLIRRIVFASDHVRLGGLEYKIFEGRELSTKTIGVIGSGNIGSKIVKIAKGFGMKVLVHTKNPTDEKVKTLGIEKFSTLKELLKNADVVVICVPLNLETKGMIGKSEIALLKKTAIIVNVARPTIIDEVVLSNAILNRRIAGAALDLFLKDPFDIKKYPLQIQEMANMPNVIITPHIASETEESYKRLEEMFMKNIQNFLKGDLTNCVN